MIPIYAYLWFDIEDYVTREADDLPLRAFEIVDKYGIPVTCKLVAQKVRRLEENGRSDVISAIARHDVGYHLNNHSQHPTLYEYLRNLDVFSGAEEFFTRETDGLKKVQQTFSRNPSCFGHPGPTWAPHVYPALVKLKIPVYLDETPILNLKNKSYWYCGVLNLNGANRNFINFDYTFEREDGLEVLKKKFRRIHDKLQKQGGGAVSILFHLHTVINKEFWDQVNFASGKNTPKEKWLRPPAQPAEITERAWANFEEFVKYMKSFQDVKFITASDAARIYQRSQISLDDEQLLKLARRFLRSSDYIKLNEIFLSPAEVFYAVTKRLVDQSAEPVDVIEPFGPNAHSRSSGKGRLNTKDFVTAAKEVLDQLVSQNRLPNAINVGDYAQLSPQDFLATACRLLLTTHTGKPLPEWIKITRAQPPNQKYIFPEEFSKACKWPILPKGFKGPNILIQAKLQAWTLKPAQASSPYQVA